MDFYEILHNLTTNEREIVVKARIEALEKEDEEKHEDNTIGFLVGHQPKSFMKEHDSFGIDMRCFYSGYIRKNSKIVYAIHYNNSGMVTNNGNYYYMDSEDYLYDFCDYISQEEVSDIYDLLDHILYFLRNYFGFIKRQDRETMFCLLQDHNGEYLDSIKEHGISWFKGKGNAMCSEYAAMAENLLTLFGIDSYIVIGYEQTKDKEDGEYHAYNLISFEEDGEETNALIDFANFVKVLDVNFRKIGEAPFIAYLDVLDEEFVRELVYQDRHLTFEDYDYYILGDSMIQIGYDRTRDYFVNSEIKPDKSFQKMKKL